MKNFIFQLSWPLPNDDQIFYRRMNEIFFTKLSKYFIWSAVWCQMQTQTLSTCARWQHDEKIVGSSMKMCSEVLYYFKLNIKLSLIQKLLRMTVSMWKSLIQYLLCLQVIWTQSRTIKNNLKWCWGVKNHHWRFSIRHWTEEHSSQPNKHVEAYGQMMLAMRVCVILMIRSQYVSDVSLKIL